MVIWVGQSWLIIKKKNTGEMALPLAQVAYKIYKSHKLMQGVEEPEEDEEVPSDAEEELSGGEEEEPEEEEDDDEWVPKERRSRIEEDEEQWTLKDFSWYIQFVFVFIALGNSVRFGMEALRYRTVKDYYVNGDLADSKKNTNWWKTGNGVFLQGGFWIWTAATITQMLSLFDIGTQINFYVWEWGVLFAFGILNAIYGVLSWMSYDAAYKELK